MPSNKPPFTPIDIQHTQSVSVPIRHPRDRENLWSDKLRDKHIHRKYYNKIPGTYGILMRLASELFSWSMAEGLLAVSSRYFPPTINHGPLSASRYFFCFSFLSKRSERRMPPAERKALYMDTDITMMRACRTHIQLLADGLVWLTSHHPYGYILL